MKSRSLIVMACLSAVIGSVQGVAQPPNPVIAPPPKVPNPVGTVPNPAARPQVPNPAVPNPAARPNPVNNPATTKPNPTTSAPTTARPNPPATGKPNTTATNRNTAKEDELKPQVLSLNTRDGVKLRCVYFPSDRGKKAIPIIIVHEMGGQSAPFVTSPNERLPSLAMQLQRQGFAVICPDLRGHGGSLTQANNPKELDRTRFGKKDVMAIINMIWKP